MPLPEEHLRDLRGSLQIHERRLAFLEDQIRVMNAEADYHRDLLALGRDARLLGAVSAALDDPDSALAEREPLRRATEESWAERSGLHRTVDLSTVFLNLDGRAPTRVVLFRTASVRRDQCRSPGLT